MVNVGDKVSLKGQTATVRFIGNTQFAPGKWVGLELDTPTGKNNGTVQDVEYFKCRLPGTYGVFVRPGLLEKETAIPLNVVSIVNKLQQKLRSALMENNLLRTSIEQLNRELEMKKDELANIDHSLESTMVESEFLKSQNATFHDKLSVLQTSYDDLSADHALLKEELDIYKELENAVRDHLPSDRDLSIEDFAVLVQFNKRLELAYSSLQKTLELKESTFNEELILFKNSLSKSHIDIKTYNELEQLLNRAQFDIRLLQEQLEASLELVLVIERITVENENLALANRDLKMQVEHLTELNEIDRALEAEHILKEQELQSSILLLTETLEKERQTLEGLLIKNNELREKMKLPLNAKDQPESHLSQELEHLSIKLRECQSHKQAIKLQNTYLTQALKLDDEMISRISPLTHKSHLQLLSEIIRLQIYLETHFDLEQHSLDLTELVASLTCAKRLIEYSFMSLELKDLASQFKSIRTMLELAEKSLELIDSIELRRKIEKWNQSLLAHGPSWLSTFAALARIRSWAKALIFSFASIHLKPIANEFVSLCNVLESQCQVLLDGYNLNNIDSSLVLLLENFDRPSPNTVAELDFVRIKENVDALLKMLDSKNFEPLGNVMTIYSVVENGEARKFTELIDSLQAELELKERRVQDLNLHVELLEKNIRHSIASKNLDLENERLRLEQAQSNVVQLNDQLGNLKEENAQLERQIENLLDFGNQSVFHQTQYFDTKVSETKLTLLQALIEEIKLLKKMLVPQENKSQWNANYDWLFEPLYTPRIVASGRIFLEDTHQKRKLANGLAKSISVAKANSLHLHYLRQGAQKPFC